PSAAPSGAVGPGPGKMVSIPSGLLRAGSECFAFPRSTDEEMVATGVEMAKFEIDLLPFPNDPGLPATVNVTRDEAAQACVKQGKRLCTELEWERACKGPANLVHEWGNRFNHDTCRTQPDRMPWRRPSCRSQFGVSDLHGLVFEWTASSWGRGTTGNAATVRGSSFRDVSALNGRCANGAPRAPEQRYDDVGFRCCAYPRNSAEVRLDVRKDQTLVRGPALGPELESMLLWGMPADHRETAGAKTGFDQLWIWHPVAGEELVLGRWYDERAGGRRQYEVAAFKICHQRAWLLERMSGPAAALDAPEEQGDPKLLRVRVSSGSERGAVGLRYWHGSVKLAEPGWILSGGRPQPPR
ncbi:MAG: SUMF1/EgtB/PvdO family nonheme iron enzyme, partial [Deltaproteobacteria bacterium]|nr:SUMF1/EgtB/PvdO family nonheme iron enzyme [Deltaproteobacteria bacterium]